MGIIGCGAIGNKRAAIIKEDPASILCSTSDVNVITAGALLQQYGRHSGQAYGDWRVMLREAEPDVVIVATPNKYLHEIALGALQRGIHVLCEKPLGRNPRESEQMVKAARENGAILKTGFNHRHHPAIFKAHDLVSNGAIGQLYYARCIYGHGGRPGYEKEWRASKEICGGGELLDQVSTWWIFFAGSWASSRKLSVTPKPAIGRWRWRTMPSPFFGLRVAGRP